MLTCFSERGYEFTFPPVCECIIIILFICFLKNRQTYHKMAKRSKWNKREGKDPNKLPFRQPRSEQLRNVCPDKVWMKSGKRQMMLDPIYEQGPWPFRIRQQCEQEESLMSGSWAFRSSLPCIAYVPSLLWQESQMNSWQHVDAITFLKDHSPLKPGQHTCQRQTLPHKCPDELWANCHCQK